MNTSTRAHIPSLLSALLFIIGALIFAGVSMVMALTSIGTFWAGKEISVQYTILLTVSTIEAMILLGATFIAIQRFRNQPIAEQDASFSTPLWLVVVSIATAGLSLLIGYLTVKNDIANWLVLPMLTPLAVMFPLFIILGIGVRGLPLGNRWQSWNVFGLAMTLSPFILMFLEIFALIVLLILAIVFLSIQPGFEAQIERIAQLMNGLNPQSTAAQELLAPYLIKPGVIAVTLIYFAFIVPVFEEIFKPLGVWLLGKKLLSPAQGFALGALSGSAFGLVETFGSIAQSGEWTILLLTRIGTGALHITTSAMMGAGIAFAICERRYLRLIGLYILSVSLHGLWNALAILIAFSSIASHFDLDDPIRGFDQALNAGMALLAVFLLATLAIFNRKMGATLPEVTPEASQP